MTDTLVIKSLSGGYGSIKVFRNVEFSIPNGQTIGIFGPNGAGKTTLLSTVIGLLPAHSGDVVFNGESVVGLAAYQRARRGIGLVPEGRQVLATLTVQDNLDLVKAACTQRDARRAFDARLAEVFELFPRLKERRSQFGGTLSGGEQQMLAIARALLIGPKLLILDEPTQGLAPVIVRELEVALAKLKGRFSMIIVEQNAAFLDALTDRQLAMRAGECPAEPTTISQ